MGRARPVRRLRGGLPHAGAGRRRRRSGAPAALADRALRRGAGRPARSRYARTWSERGARRPASACGSSRTAGRSRSRSARAPPGATASPSGRSRALRAAPRRSASGSSASTRCRASSTGFEIRPVGADRRRRGAQPRVAAARSAARARPSRPHRALGRLDAGRLLEARPPVGAPTVDLTIHFRAPLAATGDWVLADYRSRFSAGGTWEEDGELWAPTARCSRSRASWR